MFATLLSFLLFGAVPAEVKTSETPTTRLYVETTPAGATIRVDGKPQGTSPKTIIVAPGAGKLTVEVELDGHATKRQEVTIQGGRVIRIEFHLAPQGPAPKQAAPATAPPWLTDAVPGMPRGAAYTVPRGGVNELVKFIQTLSEYKPKTPEEDLPYRVYFRKAIGEAAERILKLEKDPNSEASQAARFVLLTNRVYALAQSDPQQQQKTLADVRAYLEEQVKKGQGAVGASLAISLGQTLEQMGEYQRAAEALHGFAELTAKSADGNLSGVTDEMRQTAERLAAAAKEFRREDKKLVLPPKGRLFPVDLKGKTNRNANTISINPRFAGNGLAELPRGEHSFGGVKFLVGNDVIHLSSSVIQTAPPEVKGIPVDRKIVRLYVLHGGQRGDQGDLPRNGTRVGEYRLHYEDGTSATFPIIYGLDFRDWWYGGDHFPTTRGKVVWTGANFRTNTLRLYLSVWKNPHPENKVATLDYISALVPDSAPFCVAMTVEEQP